MNILSRVYDSLAAFVGSPDDPWLVVFVWSFIGFAASAFIILCVLSASRDGR